MTDELRAQLARAVGLLESALIVCDGTLIALDNQRVECQRQRDESYAKIQELKAQLGIVEAVQ